MQLKGYPGKLELDQPAEIISVQSAINHVRSSVQYLKTVASSCIMYVQY